MKYTLEEAKEKLPIDFITAKISDNWNKVGELKADIEMLKGFSGVGDLDKYFQDLVDAYLICIGQLEKYVGKKGIEVPEEKELKEALEEDVIATEAPIADAPVQEIKTEKCEDGECKEKVEIFTKLPDYDVEVEQKGGKVEIEIEPKEAIVDEWPEPDMSDISDIEDAKRNLGTEEERIAAADEIIKAKNNLPADVKLDAQMIVDEWPFDDFNMDFDEPVGDKLTDEDLYGDQEEEKK